jgi:RimJ/RimL family protein N-acetyltransferase
MIGNVALVSPDMEKYTIQCDYAISSSHWGKGITTMAVGLAVTYAFRDLEMQTINSACLERNPASSRVLEKNGFIETEKFLYNNYKFKDEPAYWFQLTREKWIKRNSERDSTPERR